MPAFDGTGPFGTGAVGMGRGGCAGKSTNMPNFAGRGFGGRRQQRTMGMMGMGRGMGCGRRGFGACGWTDALPYSSMTEEEEADMLERQIKAAEYRLKNLQKRLDEIRSEKE